MKKLIFSLLATALVSIMSVNAQSKTPKGFTSLEDVVIGKISSYAGPCMDGLGMCSGTVSQDQLSFEVALMKSSESSVTFAFTTDFYKENNDKLRNGLIIGQAFSLPQKVSEKIGLRTEFIVAKGNYKIELKDQVYYVTLNRVN